MLVARRAEEGVPCHGPGRSRSDSDRIRQDGADRPLVGRTVAGLGRPLGLRGLRHLGGAAGRALLLRAVPLAFLLARAVRRLSTQLVRGEAVVVAGLAALLARVAR